MWGSKATSETKERKHLSEEKTQDFEASQGEDSGFMSSEQCMSLGEIHNNESKSSNIYGPSGESSKHSYQEHKSSKKITNTSSALDSGVFADSVESSSEQMLLDREVNDSVSEWFCNLNLNNQPINNLSGQKSSKKQRSQEVCTPLSSSAYDLPVIQEPWEIYYLQNSDGDTHLHMAIMDGHQDVAKALIRMNPYPCLLDIQNDFFQTPLHLAVISGQCIIVRLLIFAGAETTIRDYKGNTPLHLACEKGDLACVEALTKPITLTEIQNVFGKYIESSYKKKMNLPSIHLPSDLDIRNYDGENCVHLAARRGDANILRQLVRYGADINAKEGKGGETPLHIAVSQGDEQLLKFLLHECPNINLESCSYGGMTAYQYAFLNRNQAFMILLVENGAEELSSPASDYDSDSDSDDSQTVDLFGSPGFFQKFSGAKAINVM